MTRNGFIDVITLSCSQELVEPSDVVHSGPTTACALWVKMLPRQT